MTNYNEHTPVLLEEVLSFVPRKKLTYVDMTLGRAGHASEVLARVLKGSTFYGVDRDEDALDYSRGFLSSYSSKVDLHFLHIDFAHAIDEIRRHEKGADFILMDIGVSSPQFDDPSRGFSYRYDAPLDMRMDRSDGITAKDIVNTYSEKELYRVFHDLGECRYAMSVVKKIEEVRAIKSIDTTFQLVDIIKSVLPEKELRKEGHPAKQFFLGLRYEVNDEIGELKTGVEKAIDFLNPKGRLVVISFNSEEDKIVKDAFRKVDKPHHVDKYAKTKDEDSYTNLTKKPIVPSEDEIRANPRAKASILRVLERS